MAVETTRRKTLSAAALLIGLTAGCQYITGDSMDDNTPSGAVSLGETETVGTSPVERPVISNANRTVYVDPDGGEDGAQGTRDDPLATIQEAVHRVPIYLRHQYIIDLATVPETPVTYDEDVLVPTIIGTGQAEREDGASDAGPFLNLVIRGQQDDPAAVEIGSVMFGNVIGTSAGNLFYVTVTRDSPYDDEQFALSAYGTGEVHIYDVRFTDGPSNGLLSYGAKMKASLVDLGDGNVNIGIRGKRHASIISDRATGRTHSSAYLAISNSKIGIKKGDTIEGDPTYQTRVGGLIHDYNSDTWIGLGGGGGSTSQSMQSPATYDGGDSADPPGDVDRGDVWYVDGSGELDEGFYGQTATGPVRLG